CFFLGSFSGLADVIASFGGSSATPGSTVEGGSSDVAASVRRSSPRRESWTALSCLARSRARSAGSIADFVIKADNQTIGKSEKVPLHSPFPPLPWILRYCCV